MNQTAVNKDHQLSQEFFYALYYRYLGSRLLSEDEIAYLLGGEDAKNMRIEDAQPQPCAETLKETSLLHSLFSLKGLCQQSEIKNAINELINIELLFCVEIQKVLHPSSFIQDKTEAAISQETEFTNNIKAVAHVVSSVENPSKEFTAAIIALIEQFQLLNAKHNLSSNEEWTEAATAISLFIKSEKHSSLRENANPPHILNLIRREAREPKNRMPQQFLYSAIPATKAPENTTTKASTFSGADIPKKTM